ncbi:GNAT family N-acetyltransferase [Mesorhizobium sp. CA15]|uniref:GNAT family N-acetyltransferase n=1 Tax=Mesorhizobium sp. CA15 TaxID=2876641 RepID=UPI001CD0DECD|nr:GNAT family N-acetyltransferase [Mesorhizobium sp. CA15]MBZ9867930.1 GNAT family N-acetyltransferase [Mesorhizobium sp. CA15]
MTAAETAECIVGFIAAQDEWVEQLYLDPAWTGQGIGSRLLAQATAGMSLVKLHCFQANTGARRFYERHGFRAEAFGDGSTNEEGLPDILYVRGR